MATGEAAAKAAEVAGEGAAKAASKAAEKAGEVAGALSGHQRLALIAVALVILVIGFVNVKNGIDCLFEAAYS